jgi:uncharacterized membrane protein
LLPAAIITTVLLLVATIMRREPGSWLVLTALVMLAAIFAISLAVNVPINDTQHSWAVSAPPGDWASLRDRWQIAHLARSYPRAAVFCHADRVTDQAPGRVSGSR